MSLQGGGAGLSLEGHGAGQLAPQPGAGYYSQPPPPPPGAAGNIPGHSFLQEISAFPFGRKAQALIWPGLRNTPWGKDSATLHLSAPHPGGGADGEAYAPGPGGLGEGTWDNL